MTKYRIHKETLFDLARYAAETGFCGALNDWLEEQTDYNWGVEQIVMSRQGEAITGWNASTTKLLGPNVFPQGILYMNTNKVWTFDILRLNPETGYYEGDWSDENM